MDRDDKDGTIYTLEPAILDHQELCKQEAAIFSEVRGALDPTWKCDWLSFFIHSFRMHKMYEVWCGDDYLRVQRTNTCHLRGATKLTGNTKGKLACLPVYSFHRSNMDSIAAALLATAPGGKGRIHGGVCCAFRMSPPDTQPFGMWFAYIVVKVSSSVIFVGLQNSILRRDSLESMVQTLNWTEPARPEVFYAPFK
jgi:hypothetical protein